MGPTHAARKSATCKNEVLPETVVRSTILVKSVDGSLSDIIFSLIC